MAHQGLEDHLPIERRKLYELVAERLIQDMSRGTLRPGDAIPTERRLAERYSVGRSSIREALRTLESSGLIEAVGRASFRVPAARNPFNQSLSLLVATRDGDIHELFEVRKIIEVATAGLAAERRTDEDLARMRAAIDEMSAGMDSRERYIAADVAFHLAVTAASRNRVASHMMRAVRDVMQRALASIYGIPGSPQRSSGQHAAILEAVAAGRPDEARERMREHLLSVEHDIGATLLRLATDGAGAHGEGTRG